MNVDRILDTFHRRKVDYLLIGGMNFLLRHAPVLTYDVDLWIDDTPDNLARCEDALVELGAEWGPSEEDWGPVARRKSGWLGGQMVFCVMSPHGAIDVFRAVKGLASWRECRARASVGNTPTGVPFPALADEDMLESQLALPEKVRKRERIRALKQALGRSADE